ncbi:hypothetical protein K2X14_00990 [Acetobacter sp. TBRC 12305]|uniref:Uncharacterized protein n=1 Tax=Acetobacter garciniae TaxID=2817435 RepID=A0A939HG12_9PROT|nr:hypothetical protein [Acetobacter garciniae]MBO1323728.1 hypothetical protein [Acetobacter garciniae]MBX0343417.1 hypothetical protein [Acetobacter garciniae]
MSEFDPKEVKLLSDILALVLEEQAGQSAAALETLRRRAQRNATTGGALKNLFQTLAVDPSRAQGAAAGTRARAANTRAKPDMPDTYRTQLREMADSINRLDRDLRTIRSQNESLKAQLYLTQQSRAELQTHLAAIQLSSRYSRKVTIVATVMAGLLTGIAGTEFFHVLYSATARPAISDTRSIG